MHMYRRHTHTERLKNTDIFKKLVNYLKAAEKMTLPFLRKKKRSTTTLQCKIEKGEKRPNI